MLPHRQLSEVSDVNGARHSVRGRVLVCDVLLEKLQRTHLIYFYGDCCYSCRCYCGVKTQKTRVSTDSFVRLRWINHLFRSVRKYI